MNIFRVKQKGTMCNQCLINGNMIISSNADAVSHLLEWIKAKSIPFPFTCRNSVHFYTVFVLVINYHTITNNQSFIQCFMSYSFILVNVCYI